MGIGNTSPLLHTLHIHGHNAHNARIFTHAHNVHTSCLLQSDMDNHLVRLINVSTGTVTTLAGSGYTGYADGQGSEASFYQPVGAAVDATGTYALIVRVIVWGVGERDLALGLLQICACQFSVLSYPRLYPAD